MHDDWLLLFAVGLAMCLVEQLAFETGGTPHSFVYKHIHPRHAVIEIKVAPSLCAWGKPSVGSEGQT